MFKRSKLGSSDRATLRFALGKTDEAIQDYGCALQSLDYYEQTLPASNALKS